MVMGGGGLVTTPRKRRNLEPLQRKTLHRSDEPALAKGDTVRQAGTYQPELLGFVQAQVTARTHQT